jgi:GNAT superfamily N-acetyltransferase
MTTELARLDLRGREVVLRRAVRDDVAAIVRLLADDHLGQDREEPDGDLASYLSAFDAVDADPTQLLIAGTCGGEVVATMQVSFIRGLSRRGALRAGIEAVRVRSDYRGVGLGGAMFRWAIAEARDRGCALVQLTSDASRESARRFYRQLGFVASHVGFKLAL